MSDENLILRRLLLAKEFYVQAAERSYRQDSISKMMAIHNFHIAVEITLKAILLRYSIRTEKTLNLDFESIINEVDKNGPAKLRYRQELRSLNQLRGLIQHQAIEPDISSMEDFRVLTRRFLEATFEEYFKVDLNSVSRISLIVDDNLKRLIDSSQGDVLVNKPTEAAVKLIVAFKFASDSLESHLPSEGHNSSFFVTSRLRLADIYSNELLRGIEDIFSRIREAEKFSAILGSGVSLAQLKRFERLPVDVQFSISGNPVISLSSNESVQLSEVEWAIDFVISTILMWQQLGVAPSVREALVVGIDNVLQINAEKKRLT